MLAILICKGPRTTTRERCHRSSKAMGGAGAAGASSVRLAAAAARGYKHCRQWFCAILGKTKEGRDMGILMRLVVGIVAGWLAGQVIRGKGFGLVGDLVLGLVGGWLGGELLGGYVSSYGIIGTILVATLGAVILVTVVRLLRRV